MGGIGRLIRNETMPGIPRPINLGWAAATAWSPTGLIGASNPRPA